jgi:hypothetical protein
MGHAKGRAPHARVARCVIGSHLVAPCLAVCRSSTRAAQRHASSPFVTSAREKSGSRHGLRVEPYTNCHQRHTARHGAEDIWGADVTGSDPGAAGKLLALSSTGGFHRMVTMPSSSPTLAHIAMRAPNPPALLHPNHATLVVTDTAGCLSILDEVTGTVRYTFTAKRNGSQPWGGAACAVMVQPLAMPPPTITSVTATPTLGTAPLVPVPVACGVQVAAPPTVSLEREMSTAMAQGSSPLRRSRPR